MIRNARTNIRAEIDTQYEILSQMIEDIADHYQEEETDSFYGMTDGMEGDLW